jgi:hypothetical protein
VFLHEGLTDGVEPKAQPLQGIHNSRVDGSCLVEGNARVVPVTSVVHKDSMAELTSFEALAGVVGAILAKEDTYSSPCRGCTSGLYEESIDVNDHASPGSLDSVAQVMVGRVALEVGMLLGLCSLPSDLALFGITVIASDVRDGQKDVGDLVAEYVLASGYFSLGDVADGVAPGAERYALGIVFIVCEVQERIGYHLDGIFGSSLTILNEGVGIILPLE